MQVALGWSLEDFTSAAKVTLETGSMDMASLQNLAHARQVQLSMQPSDLSRGHYNLLQTYFGSTQTIENHGRLQRQLEETLHI